MGKKTEKFDFNWKLRMSYRDINKDVIYNRKRTFNEGPEVPNVYVSPKRIKLGPSPTKNIVVPLANEDADLILGNY
jgi:hypothetical protein